MSALANLFARLGPPWVQIACVAAVVLLLSAVCARPVFAAACARGTQNGVGAVALFYGEQVPVDQLSQFDTVVVEADSGFDPRAASATAAAKGAETPRCTNWYAYVSVGEVTKDRDYMASMPKKWLIGRNAEWAEQAVREAVSLPAEEALKQGVIEYVAPDLPSLLTQLNGKKINVLGQEKQLQTADAPVERYLPDWRVKLLAVITDPSIALILMALGVYGLFFEFLNPGMVAPGVLGGISLLLGLYALQLLPVNYAGLGLIVLGMGFMVAEAFMPTFGALGVGGIASFVLGALILIDTDLPGFGIPLWLILMVAMLSALLIIGMAGLALKARRRPVMTGEMSGEIGEVVESIAGGAWVHVHGENWRALSDSPLHKGQKVRVLTRDRLVLQVTPVGNHDKGE